MELPSMLENKMSGSENASIWFTVPFANTATPEPADDASRAEGDEHSAVSMTSEPTRAMAAVQVASAAHSHEPHEHEDTQARSPKISARRDREFRRYAEVVAGLQPFAKGQTAVSSRDLTLTAYAQLVALRLNAKCALISLFDGKHQYIIAEATRTLSLQRDTTHALSDAMWFGVGVLERQQDFNWQTLKANKQAAEDDAPPRRYIEIQDLLQDVRYAEHRFVLNAPHARSYVGVPLKSAKGYSIGTLSFLDDKVRQSGITDEEVVFLQDLGMTIMSHLELSRIAIMQARGMKMVKGLSRFVEGKSDLQEDLDEESFAGMHERQAIQTAGLSASHRTHAMNAASNSERWNDARETLTSSTDTETCTSHGSSAVDAQPLPRRSSTAVLCRSSSAHSTAPLPGHTAEADSVASDSEGAAVHTGSRVKTSPGTRSILSPYEVAVDSLQEDLLSRDVRTTFERAATIINSAMQVSGTLFLDASIGEFGRLRTGTDSSSSIESGGARKYGQPGRTKDTSEDSDTSSESKPTGKSAKVCRKLASAYDAELFANGAAGVLHKGVPERFLASLMRKYPYGKIWTFSMDGNASSDELSESSVATDRTSDKADASATVSSKSTLQRKRVHADGPTLTELFPGVRSLCLLPMADQSRKRLFAGALVWSYDPLRCFSMLGDLNYLGAFCDVVMAEVGRLDIQAETRTATKFISSISHELRSPLHGILGGVECLQDKENAVNQDEMLQMIESSGRSLLEIIDHLLEYSHGRASNQRHSRVNKVLKNREASANKHGRSTYSNSGHNEPIGDLALITEEILDTALWSIPKPTPASRPDNTHHGNETQSATPIKVILEVDDHDPWGNGWWYRIDSGAWRRIIQNLVSNSIKYTDPGGYVKISLTAEPDRDEKGRPVVSLVCLDSGRGMSQHYLQHSLWSAFAQEDSDSQGTGLGLSLVHGIVKEMGGRIDIQSRKGVGTMLRIKVPLQTGQPSRKPLESKLDEVTKERLKSSTFALIGFLENNDHEERTVEAGKILQDSIEAGCRSHGMQPATEAVDADVFIVSERTAIELTTSDIFTGSLTDIGSMLTKKPTIVLCSSVDSSRKMVNAARLKMEKVIMLSQPLGPRKLSKALIGCLLPSPAVQDMKASTHAPPSANVVSVPSAPVTSELHHASRSDEARPMLAAKKSSSRRPKTGLATLLVDDNNLNLSLLQVYMNKNGHDYKCATNGLEAVESYRTDHVQYQSLKADQQPDKLNHDPSIISNDTADMPVRQTTASAMQSPTAMQPPTVILMDLNMPVMSGLQATREIRSYERSAGIHPSTIVALTAMESAEARQEAFGSGVDLFLTKPLRLADLTGILEKHMREAQERAAP